MKNNNEIWKSFVDEKINENLSITSKIYQYLTINWAEDLKNDAIEKYSPLMSAMDTMKNLLNDINKDPVLAKQFYEEIKKRQN